MRLNITYVTLKYYGKPLKKWIYHTHGRVGGTAFGIWFCGLYISYSDKAKKHGMGFDIIKSNSTCTRPHGPDSDSDKQG